MTNIIGLLTAALLWATEQIAQIPTNIDQPSKRSNLGSRQAKEELKKSENHQNFTLKMMRK